MIDAVQSDKASSEDIDPEAGYQDEAGLFPDSFDEDYIGTVWALDPKDSVQTIDIPDNDDDNLSINDESKNFHSEVVRDIRDFVMYRKWLLANQSFHIHRLGIHPRRGASSRAHSKRTAKQHP